MVAGPFHDIAVVGRKTHVASIDKVAFEMIEHNNSQRSRLLMVQVNWLQPIAGSDNVRVIAGHLHNVIAKKTNSDDYNHFLIN